MRFSFSNYYELKQKKLVFGVKLINLIYSYNDKNQILCNKENKNTSLSVKQMKIKKIIEFKMQEKQN